MADKGADVAAGEGAGAKSRREGAVVEKGVADDEEGGGGREPPPPAMQRSCH